MHNPYSGVLLGVMGYCHSDCLQDSTVSSCKSLALTFQAVVNSSFSSNTKADLIPPLLIFKREKFLTFKEVWLPEDRILIPYVIWIFFKMMESYFLLKKKTKLYFSSPQVSLFKGNCTINILIEQISIPSRFNVFHLQYKRKIMHNYASKSLSFNNVCTSQYHI